MFVSSGTSFFFLLTIDFKGQIILGKSEVLQIVGCHVLRIFMKFAFFTLSAEVSYTFQKMAYGSMMYMNIYDRKIFKSLV